MQVLGLTYRQIRARVVKLVGEKVVARLEKTVDVFKVLVTEGVPGLWKWIKDKVGDLEEMVMGGIKTFIIEKIIKAGITWLIAFLNPAAAFIKACKMIYDVIMFIIERGAEIMDFVRSILDSIGAIAKGNIGIVAQKVEDSLARALPLAISFLASLLGLGGISEKIHSIIQKVQAPVGKAVDFVVMGAVKGAKKLFGGAAKWAKGKYQQGKQWVKDKATDVKNKIRGGDDSEEGRQQRLKAAADDAIGVAKGFSGGVTKALLRPAWAAIRTRYGLKKLEPMEKDGEWYVHAEINPILVVGTGVPSSRRTPDGPNYAPIMGKLTQVVSMLTKWASKPKIRATQRAIVQQMLRDSEIAREEAEQLAAAQAKGAFAPELETMRQSLVNRLRAIQTHDPKYALVSIGEMSVTITNVKKQMPAVPVPPWNFEPAKRAEYVRQLADQQDGINAMTGDQWETNRARFLAAGRSDEGTKQQATYGRRTPRPAGSAAPHNPDQIAAGYQDPTGDPADFDVNSHIGSQWPTRVPVVDAAVNTLTPTEKLVTQMNVELSI